MSGDGDFASLLDFVKSTDRQVKVIATDRRSCSLMIKRRSFTKVSYLEDIESIIKNEIESEGVGIDFSDEEFKNEKPPTSTETC